MSQPIPAEKIAGITIALSFHAATLLWLWQHRIIPAPQESMTLFVNFIAPPAPVNHEEHRRPPPPKPKPIEKPQPPKIVAETPIVAPQDYVAPPPPLQPAPAIPPPEPRAPAAPPLPLGPVTLAGELSVSCPQRTVPGYPPTSRRLGEEGTVVLRVELDEHGQVWAARVSSSSGFARLDTAALDAVRTWRCTPAQRNGSPVRAVALQPFKFVLQES